jgi:hypothetical protein
MKKFPLPHPRIEKSRQDFSLAIGNFRLFLMPFGLIVVVRRFLRARRFLRKEPSLIKPNRAADTQLEIV